MEDFADVDAYLDASDNWPDEIKAIRPLLLGCGLGEKIKWGKPCYCLDDANIVLLQEFSDHLALMFFKGVLLDDPDDVLHAQGPHTHGPKRMKFTSTSDVDRLAGTITAYVNEAIDHERAGTELPERPNEELAAELVERLAADVELAEAFHNLTPGRQREYNLHISDAKQSSTRERRIDKVVPRILDGRGLRDRWTLGSAGVDRFIEAVPLGRGRSGGGAREPGCVRAPLGPRVGWGPPVPTTGTRVVEGNAALQPGEVSLERRQPEQRHLPCREQQYSRHQCHARRTSPVPTRAASGSCRHHSPA